MKKEPRKVREKEAKAIFISVKCTTHETQQMVHAIGIQHVLQQLEGGDVINIQ